MPVVGRASGVGRPSIDPRVTVASEPSRWLPPPRFEVAEQVSLFPVGPSASRHTLLDEQGKRIGCIVYHPREGVRLEDGQGAVLARAVLSAGGRDRRFEIQGPRGESIGALVRGALSRSYQVFDSVGRPVARVEERSPPLKRGKVLVLTEQGGERVQMVRYPVRGFVWERWRVDQNTSLPSTIDARLWTMIPVIETSAWRERRASTAAHGGAPDPLNAIG